MQLVTRWRLTLLALTQHRTYQQLRVRKPWLWVTKELAVLSPPEKGLEHVVVHGPGRSQAENLEEQCAAELEHNLGDRNAGVDCQVPQGLMWGATCISLLYFY